MSGYKKIFFLKNILITLFLLVVLGSNAYAEQIEDRFVYVEDAVPGVVIDLRYSGADNFLGRQVNGYKNGRCVISKPAAEALNEVQKDLQYVGLGIKVFDAYRPQRAVNDFVEWAKNLNDIKMKKQYYPSVEKKNLFKQGYIAAKSSHSRGSAVDLTIVAIDENGDTQELDMGTGFDLFGIKSHPNYKGVSSHARANRLLLRTLMIKHGFKPLAEEWWHFTLDNEPYPENYFDFSINQ